MSHRLIAVYKKPNRDPAQIAELPSFDAVIDFLHAMPRLSRSCTHLEWHTARGEVLIVREA